MERKFMVKKKMTTKTTLRVYSAINFICILPNFLRVCPLWL